MVKVDKKRFAVNRLFFIGESKDQREAWGRVFVQRISPYHYVGKRYGM